MEPNSPPVRPAQSAILVRRGIVCCHEQAWQSKAMLPLAIRVCFVLACGMHYAVAQTRPVDLHTPEEVLDYVLQIDSAWVVPEIEQLYGRIRQHPEQYAPILAQRIRLLNVEDLALSDSITRPMGLLHLLGTKQGMPLAVESYVTATREQRSVLAVLKEMISDGPAAVTPEVRERVEQLRRRAAALASMRQLAIRELIELKSPAVVDYSLSLFSTGLDVSAYGADYSIQLTLVEYYSAVGADEALRTVLAEHTVSPSARKAAEHALRQKGE